MSRTFVIATRGSRLALRQVELVSEALRAARPGVSLEVREIHTEGDRTHAPLSEIGGLGVFTKAIEDALLARTGDIAVHSLKDLPTELASGLVIAATPPRADVRDALVTRDGRDLASLPAGARVGTGSGRRAVQLRALRPDIETCEIRGNVETRIRKVDSGAYDGAVLAMAGLSRLGLADRAAHVFGVHEMLPAVGQAAIAIEARADDAEARALVAGIDDAATHAAVDAERAFLRRFGGGCRLPVGAHARVEGDVLHIAGMIAGDDGRVFSGSLDGSASDPAAVGAALAEQLLRQGAQAFVDA
jgi:hydroxymethylbilane synthase